MHFADLTDKTSIDYLMRELKETAADKPYIFHLGAQAHVGESWHRPYETVMANTIGTLNLLQSIVDTGLELEKFDTAGTSEEYGNVRDDVSHHHDFDDAGSLILHERSPINPKSIYATAKVAADFLTMNYYDAFGVPGVVTRMFNNYGPRQNPRYVTGTIITQALTRETIELGNLEPLRDFCFCTDGVRGHLTVAAHGKPGDVYVYGQGENISMEGWVEMILQIGEANGFWPAGRTVSTTPKRYRPGASDVMALRVGHEKLTAETGWMPKVSWEEGVFETIRWYAENRERWIGRVDWLSTGAPDPTGCDLDQGSPYGRPIGPVRRSSTVTRRAPGAPVQRDGRAGQRRPCAARRALTRRSRTGRCPLLLSSLCTAWRTTASSTGPVRGHVRDDDDSPVAIVQRGRSASTSTCPTSRPAPARSRYMLTDGLAAGVPSTSTPLTSSAARRPGRRRCSPSPAPTAGDCDSWMEAGMLTGALAAALAVLVLFILLTRLTTRRRAFADRVPLRLRDAGLGRQRAGALAARRRPCSRCSVTLLCTPRPSLCARGRVACWRWWHAAPRRTRHRRSSSSPWWVAAARDWVRFARGALPGRVGAARRRQLEFVFGAPLRTGYAVERAHPTRPAAVDRGSILEGPVDAPASRPVAACSSIQPDPASSRWSGAITGFRTPDLPLDCAIAALAYVLAMGK